MFSIRTVLSFIASVVSFVASLLVSLAHVATPALTVATVVAITAIPAIAQVEPPAVEWEKTYGSKRDSRAEAVLQTSDGGYVVAGCIATSGLSSYTDVILVKTDSSGKVVWQQTYGGTSWDSGHSVQQTSDGGYIVAGYTYTYTYTGPSGAGNNDVYLVKTDSSGKVVWQQTYGDARDDWGYSVQQTSDGGYVVVGKTESPGTDNADVYLLKTDVLGKQVWRQTYGGARYDSGSSVQQTTDGGYVVAGSTHSFGAGGSDVYLVKTDSSGKLVWQKTYGSAKDVRGFSMQQTKDGGYIVAGSIAASEPYRLYETNIYLIKLSSEKSPPAK